MYSYSYQQLTSTTSKIRLNKIPEPYKGKGILCKNETITLKEGKRFKNMKITTLNRHKTKLLRLKLLKTKVYKHEKNFNYLLLKNMETQLKKVLHIIYRFHIANKKFFLLELY